MVLEDEKVSKNKKLKRIESQKVGGVLYDVDGRRKTASLR
jgi:hypothetical protein